MTEITLHPFSEVLADFRAGKMVIIVDDADRENEGDLTVATEMITPEAITFMMHEARGLICVSLSAELAERVNLPLQVLSHNNNSPYHTPFAVSIDSREVAGRGVTASARCHTLRALLADDARAEDFVSPGHVFPLIANPSGVIGRQGQTEGSYDLAQIAGFKASGVICEILNPDGTMARGAELNEFSRKHGIKITSIQEIIRYRVNEEVLVRQVAEAPLNTDFGRFDTLVFQDDAAGKEHLVLRYGEIDETTPCLVRIHSECLTGDVFGSRRCDCGEQLARAMKRIVDEGAGMILYLRQEGRGIGLTNKLRAYELQDRGHDTVQANVALGFAPDERDFAVAAKMLRQCGIRRIRLLTNNPEKMSGVSELGIEVVERIPLVVPADEYSRGYLETKREKLGHLL